MVEERHELNEPQRWKGNKYEENAGMSHDESHQFVVDCGINEKAFRGHRAILRTTDEPASLPASLTGGIMPARTIL